MKNNQGTAIILSLVIVSVLFILTSFLVRKVLTNTTMVEKIGEEQESYALAKQGILYALDQLNTWDGTDPKYDPTDWTPNEVEQGNWSDYSNYSLMVHKDYIPTSGGYTQKDGYITIESQDLPKKLVTLQAITKNTSPLLDYVRLINSDVSFTTGQTFSDTTYGSLIHINGDLVLTGTNLLYLNTDRADRLEVAGEIRPKVSTTTVTISDPALHLSDVFLDANDNNDDGYKCGFTRNASGNLLAKEKFDTAYDNIVQNNGRYFDGAHVPSSYDQSGASPQYVSGNALLRWPLINEERYQNKVGGSASPYYVDGISSNDESGTWYDTTASEWTDDRTGLVPSPGSIQSASYTSSTAILVILDGNGELSGTEGQVGIDDGEGGGTAYNSVIESGEWRTYPTNRVIYSPDNLRVLGIIGDDLPPTTDYELTIVSGGTIYIESTLAKGTSGSSLALIAKNWIALNPTHRFINQDVVVTSGPDLWNNQSNIRGESDSNQMDITVSFGSTDIAVLDLAQNVATDTIRLKKLNFPDAGGSLTLRVYGSNDNTPYIVADDQKFGPDYTTEINGDPPDFIRAEGSYTFRYVKLWLKNTHDSDSYAVYFDAVEIPLTDLNAVCFAQNKSWAVISGNISGYPFTVNGAISENQFEQSSNWAINWPNITYTHDSTLASNPALPPSVNLVSLKRK
ncbi:hypothetical protein E3J59_05085 [Candidatus Aerophobetes bacterium]|uniref:Uncharacterized protein n=1 Tax=Aerophobetes bacterium TaxID=2030807 RepID=A0A523UPE5_UNCAE|nr:MAG: hypothetical protein E3J59_05085 [Candidatus Aerophobetes bacterium]